MHQCVFHKVLDEPDGPFNSVRRIRCAACNRIGPFQALIKTICAKSEAARNPALWCITHEEHVKYISKMHRKACAAVLLKLRLIEQQSSLSGLLATR